MTTTLTKPTKESATKRSSKRKQKPDSTASQASKIQAGVDDLEPIDDENENLSDLEAETDLEAESNEFYESEPIETETVDETEEAEETNSVTTSEPSTPIRLSCDQEVFANAMSFLKPNLPRKAIHAILNNVLIHADQNLQQVTLTVSDMTTTVSASFEATIEAGGKITLPAEVLNDVVRMCPKKDIIHLTSEIQEVISTSPKSPKGTKSQTGKKSAKPKTAKQPESAQFESTETPAIAYTAYIQDDHDGTTEIRGLDPAEFPEVDRITTKPTSLPAKVVHAGLSSVLFASSTEETKQILTSVQWTLNHTQSQLHCNATDGHQVAMVTVKTNGIGKKRRNTSAQADQATESIIPARMLGELSKTLEKVEPDAAFKFAYDRKTKRVLFEVEHDGIRKRFITQCFDGGYPDCPALLKQYQFRHTITLNRAELLDRLERLEVLADKKVNGVMIRFNAKEQQIQLSLEQDFGRGNQTMSAEIPQELDGTEVQFNVKYLTAAVKALMSSALRLTLDKPYTPAKIQSVGDVEVPELEMDAVYFLLPQFDKDKLAQIQQEEIAAA